MRLRPACWRPISPAPAPASTTPTPGSAPHVGRSFASTADLLDNFAGRLATHSERHESLLARGYVVVRDGDARVVTEAAKVTLGAALDLEFHDGKVDAVAGRTPRRRCAEPHRDPSRGNSSRGRDWTRR